VGAEEQRRRAALRGTHYSLPVPPSTGISTEVPADGKLAQPTAIIAKTAATNAVNSDLLALLFIQFSFGYVCVDVRP
jgi:hypothetical protein